MARLPRLSIAGAPHLVVQRGKGLEPVFRDDADRRLYLAQLSEVARSCEVDVHAYVLLDHEIRLLATPHDAGGLGRMMQRIGRRYVGPFNRRHGRVGALWAGRFQAAVVDAGTRWVTCLRWIEGAPLALGLVERAEDWPWSSAAHHIGGLPSALVREHRQRWTMGNTPFERDARHREALLRPVSAGDALAIAGALRGGWPIGGPAFVGQLGDTTERPLAPRPRGRPRRAVATEAV